MTTTPVVETPRLGNTRTRRWIDGTRGYLFLLPALAVFGLFSWYPVVRGVTLAFQYDNLVTPATWTGWDNFRTVFSDAFFNLAWRNTVEFTLLALVIGYGVPFLMAMFLNEMRHGQWYFRLAVYLPVVLPPVVSVLLWKWFYEPQAGLFNQILTTLNLPTSQWINSADTALASLVLEATWATFGSATLIYLASLQSIPGSLYEAAELDGAGFFRRIRHITLPQMRYILLALLLLQVIATMQVFTQPYVMTDGGPDGATTTLALLIYDYAFNYNDYGAASALSVLLATLLAALTAVYLWLTRRWSND